MATPQLSPGILVREVDLTVGRADNVLQNNGAIAGPFSLGPVSEAVDITTEEELIEVFGQPISTDRHYEYWMTASSFLSYGGRLKVVRVDGSNLNNANAGVGIASTSVKIKNFDDYNANYSSATDFYYAGKNLEIILMNLKLQQLMTLVIKLLVLPLMILVLQTSKLVLVLPWHSAELRQVLEQPKLLMDT